MATAAVIGDWKPVENNISHYSVRETKAKNAMVSTTVSYTILPRSLCALWCLIHLAQKL